MEYKGVRISWLGHAGFVLEHGESRVYIDPYQIGRGREDATHILVTHDHYDHLSIPDVDSITTEGTFIVGPPDCREKLGDVTGQKRSAAPGKTLELGEVTIETVPAYNVGKKFHPKDEQWVGYVVEIGGVRVYHSGDTDLIPEMGDVRCDVALLPVSGTYVMTSDEAAEATKRIKPQLAIPMHWGSFIGDRTDAEAFKKKAACRVEILEKA